MKKGTKTQSAISSAILFLPKYFLIFIISVPAFILIVIYKVIATILIKIRYKDAVFLSSQDSFLSYGKTLDENQLQVSFLCLGSINIDRFRVIVDLQARQNPHLVSYVKKQYGYYFWLKEKNFNIKDHLLYHSDITISNKEELKSVQKHLYYNTRIPEKFSPWFFHFVPVSNNSKGSKENSEFYMISTFYHQIGDGYSVIHQFFKCLSLDEPPKLLLPATTPSSVFKESMYAFMSVFLWPYISIKVLKQRSVFRPSILFGRQIFVNTGRLKTSQVKKVKRITKIPFAIVLTSCIIGALEKFLRRILISVPEEITVAIPKALWTPDDKITLTNNFFVIYLTLPLNQKDGLHRLKEIWDICNSKRTRYTMIFDYVMMKWLGNIIPTFLGQSLYANDPSSVTLSIVGMQNFPNYILEGRTVVKDSLTTMVNLFSNVGVVVQTLSFGEDITVSIHSKSTITYEEDLSIVFDDIRQELQEINDNISQWDQYF